MVRAFTKQIGVTLGGALFGFSVLLGARGCTDTADPSAAQTAEPTSSASASTPEPPPHAGAAGPPSVVLVVIDTERADFTSTHGSLRETTPFAAEVAAGGVVFTNMFASAPWTAPAMASVMTGLYPSEHGIVDGHFVKVGGENRMVGQQILPDEAETLAEHFEQRGYTTFGVVTNFHMNAKLGFAQGFEHYVGGGFHNLPYPEIAVEALKRRVSGSAPYFIWLHYFDPHYPYVTHSPWFGRWNESGMSSYEDLALRLVLRRYRRDKRFGPDDPLDLHDVGDLTRTARSLARNHNRMITEIERAVRPGPDGSTARFLRAAYVSEIRRTDEAVRKAFTAMGVGDREIVVITADHGEEIFDRGGFGHRQGSLYQELVHVPLILQLPEGRGAGRVVDAPCSTVDLLPTLLDAAGFTVPEGLAGVSLLPLIDGGTIPSRPIYTEVHNPTRRAIIEYPYKYIHDFATDQGRLFNLADDPDERRDLAGRDDARVSAMRARLHRWVDSVSPRWGTERQTSLSEEERQQLRAMGYVQ